MRICAVESLHQTGSAEAVLHGRVEDEVFFLDVCQARIDFGEAINEPYNGAFFREGDHHGRVAGDSLSEEVLEGLDLELEPGFIHAGEQSELSAVASLEAEADMDVREFAKVSAIGPVHAEEDAVRFQNEPIMGWNMGQQFEQVLPVQGRLIAAYAHLPSVVLPGDLDEFRSYMLRAVESSYGFRVVHDIP